MDCIEFTHAFHAMAGTEPTPEMSEHIDKCPTCGQKLQELHFIARELGRSRHPQAPSELRQNVLTEIDKLEKVLLMKKRRNIFVRSGAALAAAIAIALIILAPMTDVNHVRAAQVFEKALDNSAAISTMVMELRVRSRAGDDFAVITPDAPFAPYTITVDNTGNRKWKIEKENKRLFSDGGEFQTYVNILNVSDKGYQKRLITTKEPYTELYDWFINIIDPARMYKPKDIKQVLPGRNFQETTTTEEITIKVTISPRTATTRNNLNSIIEGRENVQTYVFDKESMLLKSLRIEVMEKGSYITILETKDIRYNLPVDPSVFSEPIPEQ